MEERKPQIAPLRSRGFLLRSVGSSNYMRLSSPKGAHTAPSGALQQEIRVRSVEKHFQERSAELQIPRLRSG
jgi:hypothetical protein